MNTFFRHPVKQSRVPNLRVLISTGTTEAHVSFCINGFKLRLILGSLYQNLSNEFDFVMHPSNVIIKAKDSSVMKYKEGFRKALINCVSLQCEPFSSNREVLALLLRIRKLLCSNLV